MQKKQGCEHCANTGILKAFLSKEGEKRIITIVCANHYNNEAAEKTMTGMHVASGLNVEVLRVEKPVDKQ